MNIKSTTPDAYCIFYPYTKYTTFGGAYDSSTLETKPLIIRKNIISISTTKPKGGVGSFRITLAASEDYKRLISTGTWCLIYISDTQLDGKDTSAKNSGLKMLGIVRSSRRDESTDPSSGITSVRYDISGEDFQSAMNTQVYINPILRPVGTPDTNPIIDAIILFKKQFSHPLNPGQMVEALISAILGQNKSLSEAIAASGVTVGGIYGFPPMLSLRIGNQSVKKFIDALVVAVQENLLGQITVQPDLGSLFSLWSMLQSYCHSILNEIYTDLFPYEGHLQPTFICRAIPFTSARTSNYHNGTISGATTLSIADSNNNPNRYINLYTSKVIGDDEIMGINYGKSDAERANFFFVSSNLANSLGFDATQLNKVIHDQGGSLAMGDANSIVRHGIRPHIASSSYMTISSFDVYKINQIVRDLWANAYLYDNGQTTIIGSAQHIPVGTNIHFKDRGWLAHVESVSHSYTVSRDGRKSFRTRIAFVRLQDMKGNPIDEGAAQTSLANYDRGFTHTNVGAPK